MSDNSDRHAVLESLAFGNDPRLTPRDRLDALAQLAQLDPPERSFHAEIAALDGPELDRAYDGFLCEELTALLDREPEAVARMPATAERLKDALDERAEARARELADVKRIEAEIERRAEERARHLYTSRAFQVVRTEPGAPQSAETAPAGSEAPPAAATPRAAREDAAAGLPPGLNREDLERPWRNGRRGGLLRPLRRDY